MTRKEFFTTAVLSVGVTLGLSATGCGGDDDAEGAGGSGGGSSGCSNLITGNHGHSFTVSQADIDAGEAKTYSIQGGSPHDHTITLSPAHFTTLKAGGSVSVESSSAVQHTHPVTVTCA